MRLIGAERQPTSDCRQSLQQSHSVNDGMKIQEDEGRFIVNLGFRFGFYIGGSNDWTKLVDALDEIFAERGQKIVERLQARTGREWSIAQGPPPAATPTRRGAQRPPRSSARHRPRAERDSQPPITKQDPPLATHRAVQPRPRHLAPDV